MFALQQVYITIYINSCNLVAVCSNITSQNQTALADLFELFLTYEISDSFAGEILRVRPKVGATWTTYICQINYQSSHLILATDEHH